MQSAFPNMLKAWYDSVGGDAIGLTWSKEGLKVPTLLCLFAISDLLFYRPDIADGLQSLSPTEAG